MGHTSISFPVYLLELVTGLVKITMDFSNQKFNIDTYIITYAI